MNIKIQNLITLSGSALALTLAPQVIAQTIPGPQPTICNRACWGARAPNGTCGSMSGLNRVIIHHTASASHWNTTSQAASAANVRGLQNHDMDVQGFCDIEYHWMIDKFGHIFEARYGAYNQLTRAYHDACNNNSHGISFMAYFHPPYNHVPSQTMLNQMYDLIAWRMPAGWSPYGTASYCYGSIGVIDGHRKVVATACPGDGFYPLIGDDRNGGTVRDAVAARRRGIRNKVCDFNGDGKTDIGIYRPSNGQWWVENVIGGTVLGGAAGDLPVPGDYNGDGRADIGIYRPSNGQWWVENVIAGRVLGGAAGDIPVPGDYNGDGRTDIGIYRPSNGQWWVENVIAGRVLGGAAGDIPIPGDYNGDGRTDIGIYRPSNGQWWVENVIAGRGYGGAVGDIPVPGDYNGDGRTDIGIFRPSSGQWWVENVIGGSVHGQAGDIPVPGDYNGDGRTDVAIYRPSNGQWWVVNVIAGTGLGGAAGDFPLPLPAGIKRVFFP